MKMTVKKIHFTSRPIVSYLTIEADTQQELLVTFFRDYQTRYKYCHDLHFIIQDQYQAAAYRDWLQTVPSHAGNSW